jgi:hypothetical protein
MNSRIILICIFTLLFTSAAKAQSEKLELYSPCRNGQCDITKPLKLLAPVVQFAPSQPRPAAIVDSRPLVIRSCPGGVCYPVRGYPSSYQRTWTYRR